MMMAIYIYFLGWLVAVKKNSIKSFVCFKLTMYNEQQLLHEEYAEGLTKLKKLHWKLFQEQQEQKNYHYVKTKTKFEMVALKNKKKNNRRRGGGNFFAEAAAAAATVSANKVVKNEESI